MHTTDTQRSTNPDTVQLEQFRSFLAEDGHKNYEAAQFAIGRRFYGVEFQGKDVLEIGSGKGLMSLHAAMRGASRVVSMEPELAGSRSEVTNTQLERVSKLGLNSIEIIGDDFNEWDPPETKFDIVMLFATINHLCESPHHALRDDQTYRNFVDVAKKLKSLLRPGGVVVFTDTCRYGFFWWMKKFGVKPPWKGKLPSINWRIHQNPSTWRTIFRDAGFSRVSINYPIPFKLRMLSPMLNNSLANFFLLGSFIIHCHA